jgi:Fe-Mn family superoxide dismutase
MFTLSKLPFEKNSLEPYISFETIEYHYWKHHQTYVDNLNKLIVWTEFESKTLEEIIKSSEWWIFNNAAQVWNHTFYWNCLASNSSKVPDWKIAKLIDKNFWNFEKFKEEFSNKAISNFGSGWTWLVQKENWDLEIVNTSNANTPLTTKDIPLLVIDVWEHAYYIDVRNARAKYVENFWNLVNWEFVEGSLK